MGLWISRLILLAAVLSIVVPSVVFAEGDAFNGHSNLLQHRAFYSLSMKATNAPEQFVDVSGVVRTALEKTCDGWITSERVKVQVSLQFDKQWNQEITYTGWESFDGKYYRFATRSLNNGETIKYRGVAHSKANSFGEAIYSEPKKITMKLPPETHFYFGLTSWLIKKARSGARRAETFVFNGTDSDGLQKVIAFIIPLESQTNKLGSKFNTILGSLENVPGWKMHIAFYPQDEWMAEPDYEIQAVILDNGVMPKLDLVFPFFTIVQMLEKIEVLKATKC